MSTDGHADDLYVEDLYAGDPATFVARRDQLVRDLRAAGERASADAVKALRRPTASAVVVNALARSQPQLVEAVLATAGRLAQVQRRALSGLSDADVRGAVRAHHTALAEAVAACAPSTAALADEVRATLLTAGLDDDVADRVRRGVLATAATPPDASEALLLSAPLGVVRDRAADPAAVEVAGGGDDERSAARRAKAAETALAAQRRVATAAIAEAERQLARAQADRVAAARKQRTADAAAAAARSALGPAEAEVARLAALLAAAERERGVLATRAGEAATEAAGRTAAARQAEEAVVDAEALLAAATSHLKALGDAST